MALETRRVRAHAAANVGSAGHGSERARHRGFGSADTRPADTSQADHKPQVGLRFRQAPPVKEPRVTRTYWDDVGLFRRIDHADRAVPPCLAWGRSSSVLLRSPELNLSPHRASFLAYFSAQPHFGNRLVLIFLGDIDNCNIADFAPWR